MKRVIAIFILILFLGVAFASAQTPQPQDGAGGMRENPAVVQGDEIVRNISGAPSEFREKTNEALAKEITIPENLQIFARVLFGLKADEKVDLQTLVTALALWVIAFLLIHEGIGLFFKGGKGWAIGAIVTIIGSSAGGITVILGFLVWLSTVFGFLEKNSLLQFAFLLILLAIVYYIASKFMKVMKNRTNVEEMERMGNEIGLERKIARIKRKAN